MGGYLIVPNIELYQEFDIGSTNVKSTFDYVEVFWRYPAVDGLTDGQSDHKKWPMQLNYSTEIYLLIRFLLQEKRARQGRRSTWTVRILHESHKRCVGV